MSNSQTVQSIYEAFGRGDIPAILDNLADDVRWEHWPDGNGGACRGVPWLQPRSSREEVPGFFEALGALEFHEFRPSELIESNDRVLALIEVDLAVKETGHRFRDSEIHLWTFGEDGKVSEFRHYVDTAKHVEALAS
jgi:ketosteroid isomerase-like protein